MVNGFPELGSFRAFNGLSSFEGQNSREQKTKAKKASIIMIENFIQSPKSWARGFRKITKRSKSISKCNSRLRIYKSCKKMLGL